MSRDILIRYKNIKKIFAYQMDTYWNSISSVESYYETNMDFLKPEIRIIFCGNIRRYIPRYRISRPPSLTPDRT